MFWTLDLSTRAALDSGPGDLAVAAIATVSVASKQTQSLYILKD